MPYGGKNPAAKGRGGDTELGHLTPGEVVLPREFPQQRPDLFAEIAEFFGNDIGRYTVGGGDDSINPDTGYPEFYFGPGMGVGLGGGSQFGGYAPGGGATGGAAMVAGGLAGGGGIVSGPGPVGGQITNVPNIFNPTPSVGSDTVPPDLLANSIAIRNAQEAFDQAAAEVSSTGRNINPESMEAFTSAKQGLITALTNAGLPPGETSRYNMLHGEFLPELFGPFQGLFDPRTQQEVSPAQIANMPLADFNALSGNPDTSYIGDENSPFGRAILGIAPALLGMTPLAPLMQVISSLYSAANPNSPSLGLTGLVEWAFGEDGSLQKALGIDLPSFEGVSDFLGEQISDIDLGSLGDFFTSGDPSTSIIPASNQRGPGIQSGPQVAPPPTQAELLEQLNAGIATPEQREAATAEAFSRLSGQTGQNPFTLLEGGPDETQFADVINRGLARTGERLPDPTNFGRLSSTFGDENLLSNILTEEGGIQREGFTSGLASAFPGDAFGEIDDSIIDSIIEERIGPARQQVSNFAARNLSAPGGVGANEFLAQQETEARERLGEIGGNVQSLNQLGVNAIRDTARSGISDFQLGDRFDVAPFAEQRQSLVDERTGSFGEDVRTQLGSEPLFDVSGALSAGSRAGGLVSGPQQESQGLLDVIAERELAGRTSRRGLQRSGSGAF
jgi:hypothetical protein